MVVSKLRAPLNNVHRRVLELTKWFRARDMDTTHNVETFEALLQRDIYEFIQ